MAYTRFKLYVLLSMKDMTVMLPLRFDVYRCKYLPTLALDNFNNEYLL